MSLPCSIADLIPQKGKMSFDQVLTKAKLDDSESTAIIKEDNIFLDDNHQLSNIVLIEYINQLTAAVKGYNGKNNKTAPKGLFVGIQEAEFLQTVHLGDLLTLKGFVTEEVSQVTFIQGIIDRDGEKIAGLVTKLFDAKDESEFDLLTNHGQIPPEKNGIQLNHHQPPVYLASSMHRKLHTYLHDTEIGADFISFKIACPADFDAFGGHFPGNPILPGIILLEIGKLALELLMEKPVTIKCIKKMKISGTVLPNQVISCNVKIDRNSGSLLSFSAIFKAGEDREISRFNGYYDEGKEQ